MKSNAVKAVHDRVELNVKSCAINRSLLFFLNRIIIVPPEHLLLVHCMVGMLRLMSLTYKPTELAHSLLVCVCVLSLIHI